MTEICDAIALQIEHVAPREECPGVSWELSRKLSESAGSGCVAAGEHLPNCGIVGLTVPCAEEVTDQPAVFVIEKCRRELASPIGQYRLVKFCLFFWLSWLLSVIREYWLIACYEPPHQNQIAILIGIHACQAQSLWRILFRQLIEHRIFITARFAPCRPEIDQKRFSIVLLH